MTIAETIAERFQNDGQVFEDDRGTNMEEVCREHAKRSPLTDRYEFADDSAIVISGGAWDLGFPGEGLKCLCWPESNYGYHLKSCRSKLSDLDQLGLTELLRHPSVIDRYPSSWIRRMHFYGLLTATARVLKFLTPQVVEEWTDCHGQLIGHEYLYKQDSRELAMSVGASLLAQEAGYPPDPMVDPKISLRNRRSMAYLATTLDEDDDA